MKHFDAEQWIDFVNQVVSADDRESMEKHLQTGCNRCSERLSFWQRVRQVAADARAYQPSTDDVRLAKAVFSSSGFATQTTGKSLLKGMQVLYDSFLQPLVIGARSAGSATRQMLYRADPFQIDVQIEAKPGGGMIVSGQLLNLTLPGNVASNVQVILSNMRGQLVHTVANEFGEFNGEIDNSGDLQITITNTDGKPIVISLRDALGRSPRDRH
jgi:hypothetical protein